jgi:ATP-dependent Clp protease ATP-binding subunit ClpA
MQLDSSNATSTTLDIMDHAVLEVSLQHHQMLGLGHMLTSFILRPNGSPASRILARQNVSLERVRSVVNGMYLPFVGKEQTVILYDHSARDAIARAIVIAHQAGDVTSLVQSVHLLQGLIEEADPETQRLFEGVGINQWKVQAELKRESPVDD